MQYKKGCYRAPVPQPQSLLPPDKIRDHVLAFFRALSLTAPIARRLVYRASLLLALVACTGERTASDAWRKFFSPSDVVGVKVNTYRSSTN